MSSSLVPVLKASATDQVERAARTIHSSKLSAVQAHSSELADGATHPPAFMIARVVVDGIAGVPGHAGRATRLPG